MAAVVMLLACSICGNAKIEFLEDFKDIMPIELPKRLPLLKEVNH